MNVEHKDWKRAKVVRSASGKAEKLVLRSRDLSQEWSEAAREEFLLENLSELPKVGRNCTCFSMDAHGPMRKSWFANSGLAGEFRFKECEDGQKVLDLSVRLMSDDEWAAWVKENGEPPKQVPQATEFPDTLLGVKIPKTALLPSARFYPCQMAICRSTSFPLAIPPRIRQPRTSGIRQRFITTSGDVGQRGRFFRQD